MIKDNANIPADNLSDNRIMPFYHRMTAPIKIKISMHL